ncbi:MAG: hypothetical protein V4674_00035 [Patescibacteria group bacterium]
MRYLWVLFFAFASASFAETSARYSVHFPLSEGWKLGHKQEVSGTGTEHDGTALYEWVRGEETVHTWTELFSVTVHPDTREVPSDKFLEASVAVMKSHFGADATVDKVETKGKTALLGWTLAGSKAYPDQTTLMYAFPLGKGMVTVQYARKGRTLTAPEIAERKLFLENVKVVPAAK